MEIEQFDLIAQYYNRKTRSLEEALYSHHAPGNDYEEHFYTRTDGIVVNRQYLSDVSAPFWHIYHK